MKLRWQINMPMKPKRQRKWINLTILGQYYFIPGYGVSMKNIDQAVTAAAKREHLNILILKKETVEISRIDLI